MTRRARRVVHTRIGIAAPPECRSGQARPERGVATTAATGILIVDGRRDAGRAEAVSKAASYAWIRSTASYEFRPCFARVPAHVRAFVFFHKCRGAAPQSSDLGLPIPCGGYTRFLQLDRKSLPGQLVCTHPLPLCRCSTTGYHSFRSYGVRRAGVSYVRKAPK